jgi:hypothetical protein
MVFEGWMNRRISTSRRTDLFENSLWDAGEGIFDTIEAEACAGTFVACAGPWYDMVSTELF